MCPPWLGDDARECWIEVVDYLNVLGVLGRTDSIALGRYCELLVQWKKLVRNLAARGHVSRKGKIERVRPAAQIANQIGAALTKLESEFGMTPAGRTRVRVERETGNEPTTFRLSG